MKSKADLALQECLAKARMLLENGRARSAILLLDRTARSPRGDLEAWMEFLVPAVWIANLNADHALAHRWVLASRRWVLASRRWVLASRRWVRGTKRWSRGSLPEKVDGPECRAESIRELHLLELFIRFHEEGSSRLQRELDRAFAAMATLKPWMLDFRLSVLLAHGRTVEMEDLLRSKGKLGPRRGSIEYARRVAFLALKLLLQCRIPQATIALTSALRLLRSVTGPESTQMQAQIHCHLALIQSNGGESRRAFDSLEEGERLARRWPSPVFNRMRDEVLGILCSRIGDHEKALRVRLKTILRSQCLTQRKGLSRRKCRVDTLHLLTAHLKGARSAIRLGRRSQARRLVSRARPLLKHWPEPWVRGFLHLVLGELTALGDSPAAFRAARDHFRRAEGLFQEKGTRCWLWLVEVYQSAAALHLRERNIGEALEKTNSTIQAGQRLQDVNAISLGILFQSLLLLEEEAPREALYEAILQGMGQVRDPVVLFKIIANLYLHTWDLHDRLDLTDLHLKQLDRLRRQIAPEVYEKLYQTHVTERVVSRFRRRFGGEERKGRRVLVDGSGPS